MHLQFLMRFQTKKILNFMWNFDWVVLQIRHETDHLRKMQNNFLKYREIYDFSRKVDFFIINIRRKRRFPIKTHANFQRADHEPTSNRRISVLHFWWKVTFLRTLNP